MQGEYVVNIPRLRDQSEKFLQERNIANHLSSSLKTIQKRVTLEKQAEYKKLIMQADELSKFYSDMSKAAETTANDVANVLSKIMVDLEDNAIHSLQKFKFEFEE